MDFDRLVFAYASPVSVGTMMARATNTAMRNSAMTARRCWRKRWRTSVQYVRTGMRSTSSWTSAGRVAEPLVTATVLSMRSITRLST